MNTGISRSLAGVLLAALFAFACGGGGGSAVAPTPPSSSATGVWSGHATLESVSGGECVGTLLGGRVGSRDIFAAQVVVSGSDLQAGVTYQGNQIACEFSGTSQGTSLSMTTNACRVGQVLSLQCSGGVMREIELRSRRIEATADNGFGTGSDRTTWDVRVPGNAASVGTLSVTATFTWNRLGIPWTDFHVFDGSILPGYVDGTVTIPADTTPFCEPCGWY